MNDCDNCRHDFSNNDERCGMCRAAGDGLYPGWEGEEGLHNVMGPWPEPPEFNDDDAKVFGVPPLVTELERLRVEVQKLERVRKVVSHWCRKKTVHEASVCMELIEELVKP